MKNILTILILLFSGVLFAQDEYIVIASDSTGNEKYVILSQTEYELIKGSDFAIKPYEELEAYAFDYFVLDSYIGEFKIIEVWYDPTN